VGHQKQLADGIHAVGKTDIKQMKNWQTTLLGILTIIASASSAGRDFLTTGQLPDLGLLFASLTAGFGLVMARDARN
jgi:hypothetical protein